MSIGGSDLAASPFWRLGWWSWRTFAVAIGTPSGIYKCRFSWNLAPFPLRGLNNLRYPGSADPRLWSYSALECQTSSSPRSFYCPSRSRAIDESRPAIS